MRVLKYATFLGLALLSFVSFGFMYSFLLCLFAAPMYSVCIRR